MNALIKYIKSFIFVIYFTISHADGYQNGGVMMESYDGGQPSSTSSDANSVFVTNLQWWTTDVELEAACSQYGPVATIRFIEDRACGKSRGMAVVDFAHAQSAQACIDGMTGTDINGRPCRVQRQMQRGTAGGNAPQMPGGGHGRGGMQGGRGGGRGGRGGRGDGGMMMMGGAPGGMDPSMMGMQQPWGMPQQMMMGGMQQGGGGGGVGGGFKPPPPPGAPPQ